MYRHNALLMFLHLWKYLQRINLANCNNCPSKYIFLKNESTKETSQVLSGYGAGHKSWHWLVKCQNGRKSKPSIPKRFQADLPGSTLDKPASTGKTPIFDEDEEQLFSRVLHNLIKKSRPKILYASCTKENIVHFSQIGFLPCFSLNFIFFSFYFSI